jgi:hypothetical protein
MQLFLCNVLQLSGISSPFLIALFLNTFSLFSSLTVRDQFLCKYERKNYKLSLNLYIVRCKWEDIIFCRQRYHTSSELKLYCMWLLRKSVLKSLDERREFTCFSICALSLSLSLSLLAHCSTQCPIS